MDNTDKKLFNKLRSKDMGIRLRVFKVLAEANPTHPELLNYYAQVILRQAGIKEEYEEQFYFLVCAALRKTGNIVLEEDTKAEQVIINAMTPKKKGRFFSKLSRSKELISNPDIKILLIETLSEIGTSDSFDLLRSIIQDEKEHLLREAARSALENIDRRLAVEETAAPPEEEIEATRILTDIETADKEELSYAEATEDESEGVLMTPALLEATNRGPEFEPSDDSVVPDFDVGDYLVDDDPNPEELMMQREPISLDDEPAESDDELLIEDEELSEAQSLALSEENEELPEMMEVDEEANVDREIDLDVPSEEDVNPEEILDALTNLDQLEPIPEETEQDSAAKQSDALDSMDESLPGDQPDLIFADDSLETPYEIPEGEVEEDENGDDEQMESLGELSAILEAPSEEEIELPDLFVSDEKSASLAPSEKEEEHEESNQEIEENDFELPDFDDSIETELDIPESESIEAQNIEELQADVEPTPEEVDLDGDLASDKDNIIETIEGPEIEKMEALEEIQAEEELDEREEEGEEEGDEAKVSAHVEIREGFSEVEEEVQPVKETTDFDPSKDVVSSALPEEPPSVTGASTPAVETQQEQNNQLDEPAAGDQIFEDLLKEIEEEEFEEQRQRNLDKMKPFEETLDEDTGKETITSNDEESSMADFEATDDESLPVEDQLIIDEDEQRGDDLASERMEDSIETDWQEESLEDAEELSQSPEEVIAMEEDYNQSKAVVEEKNEDILREKESLEESQEEVMTARDMRVTEAQEIEEEEQEAIESQEISEEQELDVELPKDVDIEGEIELSDMESEGQNSEKLTDELSSDEEITFEEGETETSEIENEDEKSEDHIQEEILFEEYPASEEIVEQEQELMEDREPISFDEQEAESSVDIDEDLTAHATSIPEDAPPIEEDALDEEIVFDDSEQEDGESISLEAEENFDYEEDIPLSEDSDVVEQESSDSEQDLDDIFIEEHDDSLEEPEIDSTSEGDIKATTAEESREIEEESDAPPQKVIQIEDMNATPKLIPEMSTLTELALTMDEGYIASLVDGKTSILDLARISGMGKSKTKDIVSTLVARNILKL